jgi:antitoxin (DNA-binding transcriptional repressor) of toxin-antitoxin stability system
MNPSATDATTIDVQEAQTQLLAGLILAMQGTDVVIAKDTVPLARLVPLEPPRKRRVAGLHCGAMRMRADFNGSLPDECWLGKGLGV